MHTNEEVLQNLKMIDDLGFKDKLNLGLRETARIVGVTAPTIKKWQEEGLIQGLAVGGRILYPKLKIAEFQASYKKDKG
ncbi:hypothetical protein CRU92_00915 [Arcobacter sp. FW59]|nr:hypothetical protein CRU92_00915 [Arcobacter sp. FW59]